MLTAATIDLWVRIVELLFLAVGTWGIPRSIVALIRMSDAVKSLTKTMDDHEQRLRELEYSGRRRVLHDRGLS